MGIFGKKRPPAETPDPYLTFLSASAANDFRALTREVLAEMGYEVDVYPDHAVDSTGRKFGFWNIAAVCSKEPRTEWRPLIAAHLQRLLTSFAAPDPFDDLSPADVARQTYARLYEESSLPPLDGFPHREFAPGIVEMLALDLPETVAVFGHDHARRFGGWEALRKQGITNLRGLAVEQLATIEAPGGTSFTGLFGSSFYTASRAMLLPGLATQLTGKAVREDLGWLLAVPNRHQLAWHVIEDAAVIGAMQGMVRFAANGYSSAPGPVSPHVYWWNGTGYEQLTHMAEDRVSIRPSPAFQAVLASLLPAGRES